MIKVVAIILIVLLLTTFVGMLFGLPPRYFWGVAAVGFVFSIWLRNKGK